LSAAARSVAAVAAVTLRSSGRTGWAPPGPGLPGWLLADGTALELPVDALLEADALTALARTPRRLRPPLAIPQQQPTFSSAHRR